MSSVLKGLNEGRNYGRDSWDSNMPGYQGDYGGAENFGRRNREWDEDDRIDARIRAEYEQKKQYEQNGKFWLKLKDSQRHLPAGPFVGKQSANQAAIDLLKQQPELKGNLVITAYGPDEQVNELSNNTLASYKKKAGADASAADKEGNYKRGDKRMSGIVKATKKQFDNDSKGVAEGRYDSDDYYNPRMSRDYGARNLHTDSGAYEFEKNVPAGEPGGERGRPQKLKGVSKSLPADAFGRTTGKIPKGKPGTVHSMMRDIDEEQLDELKCWSGYTRVQGVPAGAPGSCKKKTNEEGVAEATGDVKFDKMLKGITGKKEVAKQQKIDTKQQARDAFGGMFGGGNPADKLSIRKKGVAEGVAETLPMDDAVKVLRQYGADHFKTTSNELHFYKQGRPFSVDLVMNPDATRSITLSSLNSATRGLKGQGVAEGQEEKCPHCGGAMFSEMIMNEKKDACYYKVKSRYKVWPSAYASGALVKCRKSGADSWGDGGKKNESSILEGIEQVDENLNKWFKEKWVRFGPDGKIRGDCARGDDSEGKPKCLPQSKAQNLGKEGRASAAARKRREDPNPERSGKAINVNTKKK